MKMIDDYKGRPEYCGSCNGKCCRNYAGAYAPEQLFDLDGITVEAVKNALLTGKVVVDSYEGFNADYPHGYFLRPTHKPDTEKGPDPIALMFAAMFGGTLDSDSSKYFDQSWGGECSHFIDGKGCDLSIDKRPIECVHLVACADGNCHGDLAKYEMATMWKPYFDVIQEALDTLE